MFRSPADLRRLGFTGFHSIRALRDDPDLVPDTAGVYVVVHKPQRQPRFLRRSPAGWFKGRDPTIPTAELASRWIQRSCVAYFGRACGVHGRSSLRGRITAYVRHGSGKRSAHWGGRSIWQLPPETKLSIAWLPRGPQKAIARERSLLNDFKAEFRALPFANRRR